MGRSNGCEAERKRKDAEKRREKFSKAGNSQKDVNAKAMSIVCSVCSQCFMQTQIKMAEMHHENKHKKMTFAECFPMCVEAEEEEKDPYADYAQYEENAAEGEKAEEEKAEV